MGPLTARLKAVAGEEVPIPTNPLELTIKAVEVVASVVASVEVATTKIGSVSLAKPLTEKFAHGEVVPMPTWLEVVMKMVEVAVRALPQAVAYQAFQYEMDKIMHLIFYTIESAHFEVSRQYLLSFSLILDP